MPSPYPLPETLRWPYMYLFPRRQPLWHPPKPRAHRFFHGNGRKCVVGVVGDIMVKQGDRPPRLHPALIRALGMCDLLLGTCEAPLIPDAPNAAARYFATFAMPHRFLGDILAQAGIRPGRCGLSVANNHILDLGKDSVPTALGLSEDLGIDAIGLDDGAITQAPPSNIPTYDIHGLRIAVVAWTHWMNAAGIARQDWGVLTPERVLATDWRAWRAENRIDILLGMPHWGLEFRHAPSLANEAIATHLIDRQGFDAILGSHPHSLQRMQWFDGGICQYSLGNFCFTLGNYCRPRNASLLLVPLLLMELADRPAGHCSVAAYRLEFFFEAHTGQQSSIIPLHEAPAHMAEPAFAVARQLFGDPQSPRQFWAGPAMPAGASLHERDT